MAFCTRCGQHIEWEGNLCQYCTSIEQRLTELERRVSLLESDL